MIAQIKSFDPVQIRGHYEYEVVRSLTQNPMTLTEKLLLSVGGGVLVLIPFAENSSDGSEDSKFYSGYFAPVDAERVVFAGTAANCAIAILAGWK